MRLNDDVSTHVAVFGSQEWGHLLWGWRFLFLLSLWFFNDSLQIPAEDGVKGGVAEGSALPWLTQTSPQWLAYQTSRYIRGLGRSPRVH